MKIRIKENTLRYRLSKSEVAKLAQDGMLEQRTEFMSSSLIYAIHETDQENLAADFIQSKITLYVPKKLLQRWSNTDDVAIDFNMPLLNGDSLYLLLEKDFKCIDVDAKEDQSDYFANPLKTC